MNNQEARKKFIERCANLAVHNMCADNDCIDCEYDVAINCIEKQIPKKPIEKESNFPNHLIVSCPECCHSFGAFIRDNKMSKITTYRSAKFNAWCPSCGNKLDWSDNE